MQSFFSRKNVTLSLAVAGLGTSLFITGCSATASGPAGGFPPPEVETVQVTQKDMPIYHEWIGTLQGYVTAAINAQVTGYLLRQDYTEGSFVKKGQLLFEIDQRPFQAAVEQAQGQLAQANGQLAQAKAQLIQAQAQLSSAEANQMRTQLDAKRYEPLLAQQAVTQQDTDNAKQNDLAAIAQVKASHAAVETAKAQIQAYEAGVKTAAAALDAAKYNLGFTRLVSPIDGVAGSAQTQVGNLVNVSSAPVTTVSTLDPIRAVFTVSEQEYLRLSQGSANGLSKLVLELILADGSTYARPGKFFFADRQVNASTGAIELTGLFPNPGNVLRPGQYAKIRTSLGTQTGALLIPQRAVSEVQGKYSVAVVDAENKVSLLPVQPGQRVGTMWVIDSGLKPGLRVVTEGVQKIGPGATVVPKPAGPMK